MRRIPRFSNPVKSSDCRNQAYEIDTAQRAERPTPRFPSLPPDLRHPIRMAPLLLMTVLHRSSTGGRSRSASLQMAFAAALLLAACLSLSTPAQATFGLECAQGKPAPCTVTICKATATAFRPSATVRLLNPSPRNPAGYNCERTLADEISPKDHPNDPKDDY
jgi:hypothetical protein